MPTLCVQEKELSYSQGTQPGLPLKAASLLHGQVLPSSPCEPQCAGIGAGPPGSVGDTPEVGDAPTCFFRARISLRRAVLPRITRDHKACCFPLDHAVVRLLQPQI